MGESEGMENGVRITCDVDGVENSFEDRSRMGDDTAWVRLEGRMKGDIDDSGVSNASLGRFDILHA